MSRQLFHIIVIIVLLGTVSTIAPAQKSTLKNQRINGVNYLGPMYQVSEIHSISAKETIHSNWVSVVPVRLIGRNDFKLTYDAQRLRWSEGHDGILESIRAAKAEGYKVMLKPHAILEKKPNNSDGQRDKAGDAIWRGDLSPIEESDWIILENNYRDYIIELSHVAEIHQIELFCIGTELREFIINREEFWKQLITEVRSIYSGDITYSANWDEYDKVRLWSYFDYIGIDAYFPVSDEAIPTEKNAMKSWRKIKKEIKRISQFENRQVIFTEYGYRNVPYAGSRPWIHPQQQDVSNHIAQNNLYTAFYRSFWNENWVAGGFLWIWDYHSSDAHTTGFSVNNKPVIDVIRHWYGYPNDDNEID